MKNALLFHQSAQLRRVCFGLRMHLFATSHLLVMTFADYILEHCVQKKKEENVEHSLMGTGFELVPILCFQVDAENKRGTMSFA